MIRPEDFENSYTRGVYDNIKKPEPPAPDSDPPGGQVEFQITSESPGENAPEDQKEIPGFGRYLVLLAVGLIIVIIANK